MYADDGGGGIRITAIYYKHGQQLVRPVSSLTPPPVTAGRSSSGDRRQRCVRERRGRRRQRAGATMGQTFRRPTADARTRSVGLG